MRPIFHIYFMWTLKTCFAHRWRAVINSLAHQQRLEVLENERKLREKEEQEAREKVGKKFLFLFLAP